MFTAVAHNQYGSAAILNETIEDGDLIVIRWPSGREEKIKVGIRDFGGNAPGMLRWDFRYYTEVPYEGTTALIWLGNGFTCKFYNDTADTESFMNNANALQYDATVPAFMVGDIALKHHDVVEFAHDDGTLLRGRASLSKRTVGPAHDRRKTVTGQITTIYHGRPQSFELKRGMRIRIVEQPSTAPSGKAT